jgi:ribosome maturation factor RimP
MHYRQDLHDLLAPAVAAVGYELLGLQFVSQGRHSTLRVYIDHPEGITVDDCAKASHQISGVMDVEDPIKGEYSLEVSSPGMERPLFVVDHYRKVIGQEAQVTLRFALDGRKKFKGIINAVDDEKITLQCEDNEITLPLSDVAKAHLVVNF